MQLLDSTLLSARDRLLNGDVVAIPTETVYGLAASIDSKAGLEKIFSLKNRPFFDPLIVHVASFKEAASLVAHWTPLADYLARTFWPGPLTLVLPKSERVDPLITSGLQTVAIRFPAHPLAQELIKLAGVPLAAPSANKFGKTSPTRAEHVRNEFPGSDLLIIDGGECEVGLESTVVAIGDDAITILRPGGITEAELEKSLNRVSKPIAIHRAESDQASPGHLEHHYMPKIPLVIVSSDEPKGLSSQTRQEIAERLTLGSIQNACELELDDDAKLAARSLYHQMRITAESGADLLYFRATPARAATLGMWDAIWNRLSRAASLDLRS